MTLHTNIRSPAVAGSFYPGTAQELSSSIDDYLGSIKTPSLKRRVKAMIVPHAGYIYSGITAASAYSQLTPFAKEISRVVLLGPSHRTPLLGIASSSHDYFQTPLGEVPLDKTIIEKLEQFSFIKVHDDAHSQEHSLEVQLPFLQKVLADFKLVPLVIGQVDDQQVYDVIESLWQLENTLFLISSDLSHYLDYERALECDLATSRAIEDLTPERIHYEQACGRSAIAGLLLSAKKHDLTVQKLDLRNSGDTAGSKDRVVGYGSWAFI